MTDKTESTGMMRLAKRIARSGVCSRRDAEKLIAEGRVTVDGETILSPATNVSDKERIAVDGEALKAAEQTRMWLFHKPTGCLTTNRDDKNRPTIFGILPHDLPRVITVGRLDMNTEGLLLLTNNGEIARALELPATGWIRRYRARVYGNISRRMIDELAKGITVEGVKYGKIDIEVESKQGANSWVLVRLKEGKNREIRKVFEQFECKVNRLIRTSYGPFQLGELKPGEVKEVSQKMLQESLGKKLLGS